jgi:hypothetical protein
VLTPEERTLRAKLGAHASWANTTDPSARTAKARATFEQSFVDRAREKHGPEASDELIARTAASLRAAHFAAIQLKSATSRRKKAAAKTANAA